MLFFYVVVKYFLVPLGIAFFVAWLWKLGIFSEPESWLSEKKKIRQKFKSERELAKRISKIKTR